MSRKTILITGSTDGIGLETAKLLVAKGHFVLLHGRNAEKLEAAKAACHKVAVKGSKLETYQADLSNLQAVEELATRIQQQHASSGGLDVLMNNAGIFQTSKPHNADGYDVRFMVNTLAPYLLTKRLIPLLLQRGQGQDAEPARVINLSSAAQSPVHFPTLSKPGIALEGFQAYAQSKLALTMWSNYLAQEYKSNNDDGRPLLSMIAVNPGSYLGTKMVKEGFGMEGRDMDIGANILLRLAVGDEGSIVHTGKYYDNDAGHFGKPHRDALHPQKCAKLVQDMEEFLSSKAAT